MGGIPKPLWEKEGERRGEILGVALPTTEASGRSSYPHTISDKVHVQNIFPIKYMCCKGTCSASLNVTCHRGDCRGEGGRGGGGFYGITEGETWFLLLKLK